MNDTAAPLSALPTGEASLELARSWRRLTRVATIVAVMTAPALFVWFNQQNGSSWCLPARARDRDRLPGIRRPRVPR